MPDPLLTSTSQVTGAGVLTSQGNNELILCDVSFNDISVKTPTYVDFRKRVLSWSTEGGCGSELEEMDARTATVVLDNRDRALDPTNTASVHYPNVVPNRRIRLRAQWAGKTYNLFRGYVDGWGPTWPEGQEWANAEAHVTATDGRKILTNHYLTSANPDVEDYPDVVEFDDPSFYYRLGEPQGTKVVSRWRRVRHKHKGKKKPHWHRTRRKRPLRATVAGVEGISGPSGTYKNTPALGEAGAIAGDTDTAVLFNTAQNEYAVVELNAEDLIDTNRLTLSCWFKPTTVGAHVNHLISGPRISSVSDPVFQFYVTVDGEVAIQFRTSANAYWVLSAANAVVAGQWQHLAGTWDGSFLRVYRNGALLATSSNLAGNVLEKGAADLFLHFGKRPGLETTVAGAIDEAAVYEKALSAARLKAHYDAAPLGFAAATTSQRIYDTLSTAGLLSEWSLALRAGSRNLLPDRYAGRAARDLIEDAVDGEGPRAKFFFSKGGAATFLDENHRSVAPWNAPLYTFGNGAGEITYAGLGIDDSDAFLYNDIRVSHDEGLTATASDTTSISRFGRHTLTDEIFAQSDADAQAVADSLLARFKNPMIRLSRFVLDGTNTAARDALLSLELGDQVTVKHQPVGGGPIISQSSYVERVALSQETKGAPIIGTFGISPR